MTNPIKESWEWLKSQFTEDTDIYDYDYYKKGGEVKAKNTIVDKIGYSEESADYLIQQSPKFAVWLADSILKNEIKASGKSKEEYIQAEDNILKRAIYLRLNYGNGIRTILDWLQHPATPSQNLRELTYEEAFQKANDWHDELEALGGEIDYVEPEENLILTTYAKNAQGVEYYWVLIPSSYCDVESKRMGHCGRTRSGNVLISLRSNSPYGQGHYINDSHITVAYDVGEGLITQAKGKKNQKPAEKYHSYLFDLVEILLRTEQESEYLNGFNGFGFEYESSEDYGFDDMSKGQIEMLYEIKPTIFDNFLGQLILYDNKIIDAPPNTTIDMVFDADDIRRMVYMSRDIRDDFVEWVLGENIESDYSNSWDYLYRNAEDYVDNLNDKNLDDVINRIVELTNLDKKTVVENGASYYLSGEDEEFDEDVFDDIRRSIASAYSNAEQSAYYKYYKDQIEGALGELGYVESLSYQGAKMSIDLMDNLSYKQIHQYINEVGDDLKGVFQEALHNGDIEKPNLYVDDRYMPYISDVVFNENFDIDYYAKGGKIGFKQYPNFSPQEWELVEWSLDGHSPYFKGKMYFQKGTGFFFIEKENGEIYKPKSSNKLFWRNIGQYAKGGKTSKAKSKKLKEQWSAYDRLAQKVAKNYEGKKVKKPYQKKYGKTYDAQEALQVGYAVATKVMGRPKKMALGGEIAVTQEYRKFDEKVFNELEDEILYGLLVKKDNQEIGIVRVEEDIYDKGVGYIFGLEVFDEGKGYGKQIIKKIFELHPTQHSFAGKATSTSKGFWSKLGAEFESQYDFILNRSSFKDAKIKMALGGEIKVYDKEPNPFAGSMKYANAYTTDDMQDALNYIDRNGGNSEKYYIVKYTLSDGQFLYRVRENMLL